VVVITLLSVSFASASPWALRETLPVEIRNPITRRWITSETHVWSLVAWEGQSFTTQVCKIETTPVFGAAATYPDAFLDSAPVLPRTVSFTDDRFAAGPFHDVVGDGDTDGDGQPGVTVHIAHPRAGSGEVYVRREATTTYDGALVGEEIVGTLTHEASQELLGASTWWLRIPLAQRTARAPGAFVLKPIESADCAAVEAAWP
jgi:hypothetical protein